MAKLKIELVIGLNDNILTFDETQVLDWSTKTFCTSEASSTIFDVFPNSGQIVLKDIDLDLYNNSINGLFDSNYNYEVNIYIDDEKIAHHIINQQPYYNYEDKTLTLNLGNELDITNELVYEGYEYPLEEQDFLTIFKNIVVELFSISEADLNKLLSTKYDFDETFGEYFSTIKIEYPYLSSKPQREILKNLLTIAKCCLIQDENKKPILVRMDGGYSGSVNGSQINHDMYKNVNFVLPDQINKGFVPSIIQKNNYNVAEISCNRVDIVSNKGVGFKELLNVDDIQTEQKDIERTSQSYADKTWYAIGSEFEIQEDGIKNTLVDWDYSNNKAVCAMIIGLSYKIADEIEIKIPKKSNYNLKTLLNVSDFAYIMQNGTFSKTFYTANTSLMVDSIYSDNVSWYSLDNKAEKETIPETLNNFDIKNTEFYFDFTNEINKNTDKNKIIKYKFPISSTPILELTKEDEEEDGYFYISLKNLPIGYSFYVFNTTTPASASFVGQISSGYITLNNCPFEKWEIDSEKFQISFLGDTYDIEFNGETVSVSPNSSTIQNPNKLVVANGGGLMQHVGDITATSFPVQYGLDLLGWAKGGIKTGELTVIKDVYNSDLENFEQISVPKPTLNVGGILTVEDEDIKKYGIYTVKLTKGSTYSYNIYNNSIIDINTGTTIIQIKVQIENGKIIFTNLNTALSDFVYINSISKYAFENIVGSKNHKIFKVGDLIVPCKDYNYTPILINSSDEPIIYQVVEATTYGEGGAVFQDLKVRQVKIKKAEELPYYLVANDTGITICIKENGYATEGSNNQIIQIAWQT